MQYHHEVATREHNELVRRIHERYSLEFPKKVHCVRLEYYRSCQKVGFSVWLENGFVARVMLEDAYNGLLLRNVFILTALPSPTHSKTWWEDASQTPWSEGDIRIHPETVSPSTLKAK